MSHIYIYIYVYLYVQIPVSTNIIKLVNIWP